jgi:phosphoglycolate phosphatase-like HAD superfamily hydrolase
VNTVTGQTWEDKGMDEGVVAEGLEAPAEVASEKMLPESRVNELIRKAKFATEQKVRQEMEAALQTQAMGGMSPVDDSQSQGQPLPQQGGMPQQGVNPEEMKNQIMQQMREEQERAYREQMEAEHKSAMEQVAQNYFLKVGKGPEVYDDFNEVMKDFKPANFANTVFLASEVDNTPEVMYELRKNPHKLAQIDMMAKTDPDMAREMMQNLSKSITENKQAMQQNPGVKEPLSRLKSSTVGADTGIKTLRDLKKSPLLRG